jgi:hypothetical protein
MLTGGYATFDSPYVCLSNGSSARLADVELAPRDSGVEVTAIGVSPVGEPGPTPVTAKRRLRTLPQASTLTEDNVITSRCADHDATEVWLELRKTQPGDLGTLRTRYVYEADGQTYRTDWFDKGYALTGP